MNLRTAAFAGGSSILGLALMGGIVVARPITTLAQLNTNGMDVYAVYLILVRA